MAAVAARLVRASGTEDVAFVFQRGTVFFARGSDEVRPAAVELIRGVYESAPRDAHFILRNTVFATREPGPFALGMTKVAAKRLRLVSAEGDGKGETLPLREVTPGEPELALPGMTSPPRSPEEWLHFAFELVTLRLERAPPIARSEEASSASLRVEGSSGPGLARDDRMQADLPRHARDRLVGAALVGPGGELLAASANSNGANRTRHAELNALLGLWHATRTKLAPGTRLYATLRPCAMCAGLLWELSAVPGTVRVYYAHEDPGSAARNTVLCPGSATRARFARSEEELIAPGCTRVSLGTDRPSI